jgi:hypothetical protein
VAPVAVIVVAGVVVTVASESVTVGVGGVTIFVESFEQLNNVEIINMDRTPREMEEFAFMTIKI